MTINNTQKQIESKGREMQTKKEKERKATNEIEAKIK